MTPTSSENSVLAALDLAAFLWLDDGQLHLRGEMPAWMLEFFPEPPATWTRHLLTHRFPFLEIFFEDAEKFLRTPAPGPLHSGIWREETRDGKEIALEATTLQRHGKVYLLLLEKHTELFFREQARLQQARDYALTIEKLQREAEKKEILIHCIVHDLANPVAGIIGCLDLIANEPLSPLGREMLEGADELAHKQLRLIRDILDVFASEASHLTPNLASPDFSTDARLTLLSVIHAQHPLCRQLNIDLRWTSQPDPHADWSVTGDPSRLERVCWNLLDNALRHSPPAHSVWLTLHRDPATSHITVTIEDEGPGVPEEALPQIFGKFFQARGTSSGKIGLGLYFCRITIEQWGGSITYRRSPRTGGAAFSFRLPSPGQGTPHATSALHPRILSPR